MNYCNKCGSCVKSECPKHPRYQAKQKPRCSCKVCWEIWEKKNEQKRN